MLANLQTRDTHLSGQPKVWSQVGVTLIQQSLPRLHTNFINSSGSFGCYGTSFLLALEARAIVSETPGTAIGPHSDHQLASAENSRRVQDAVPGSFQGSIRKPTLGG